MTQRIPKDEALAFLCEVIEKYGILSKRQYDALPKRKISSDTLARRFSSWSNAIAEAQKYVQIKDPEPEGTEPPDLKTECTQLKNQCSEKDSQIAHLQQQIRDMRERKRVHVHDFFDQKVLAGIITDTQIGSLYSRLDILEAAYDIFEHEGVGSVYHAGDLLDGEKMYRGQEYEIYAHGADAQVEECTSHYPLRKGITTYFITGNHDLSFWKNAGIDVGLQIQKARSDMVYLGRDEQDVIIGEGERTVRLRLYHPGKGTAYALSYQPQKYIESLSGGQKPQIVVFGHYHKAELLPQYRNIFGIQAGCCQSQTPFMRTRNIAAHIGFWIIEFTINVPKLVSRFKAEFFSFFEEQQAA